jgi:two-component system, chemotaxis family, chemotaxis protein CheY
MSQTTMTNTLNIPKKLLIVDDSKVSRMVIRARILDIHPEWQIIEAISGNEAIEMVDKETPDFCTMDINMPGILGTDAAEQILAKHPTMRIVIFSANIQETFQNRASSIGATFVAKPVTEKSIAEAIQHFVRQA